MLIDLCKQKEENNFGNGRREHLNNYFCCWLKQMVKWFRRMIEISKHMVFCCFLFVIETYFQINHLDMRNLKAIYRETERYLSVGEGEGELNFLRQN